MIKRGIRPGFHDKLISGKSYTDWLDLTKYVHDVINANGYPVFNDCCIAAPSVSDVGKVLTIGADGKIALATVSGVGSSVSGVSLGTTTATTQQIVVSGATNFLLPSATTTLAGLMSAADKVKVNSLPASFPTITTNQVYFGNGTNVPQSSTDLTWDNTTKVFRINGKLDVTGLIDPTGLELTPQASNPGLVAAQTLWINNGTGHLMRGSVDLETLGGTISSVFGRTGVVVATSGDYTTTQVTEGTNLYYTNARGIGSLLSGFTSGAGTVTSADTILSAIQKINGNIAASGSGTVTTASVVSANGFSGTVATASTTPAITLTTTITGLLKGNGTAISAAVSGTDYVVPNAAITAGTGTKVTYDTKGLVTSSTNATATDIVNTPSGNLAGVTVQAALNELQVDVDTINTNVVALQTLSGVAAGVTNLGTFTGSTIADNSTNKAAIQSLETALELLPIGAESGTHVDPTSKKVRLGGVLLENAAIDGNLLFGFDATNLKTASLVTDATGTAQSSLVLGKLLSQPTRLKTESVATPTTKSELVVDADGNSQFYQFNATDFAGLQLNSPTEAKIRNTTYSIGVKTDGIYAETLGAKTTETEVVYVDSTTGKLAKGTVTSGSSTTDYSAGAGALVKATGSGITFVRTTTSVWTFTIPSGVQLLSHKIYSTAGENPGANVTLVYNYTSNTVTNQGFTTAAPPKLGGWNMQTGVYTEVATGGSLAANFRPAISSVSGGNITMLCTLGSGIGALETLITGNF